MAGNNTRLFLYSMNEGHLWEDEIVWMTNNNKKLCRLFDGLMLYRNPFYFYFTCVYSYLKYKWPDFIKLNLFDFCRFFFFPILHHKRAIEFTAPHILWLLLFTSGLFMCDVVWGIRQARKKTSARVKVSFIVC